LGCIWKCAQAQVFNCGNEKVAACSISVWLDCHLTNACNNETQRNSWALVRTGENLSILNPCNQRTLLAIVRLCANFWLYFYLTVFLPVWIKRSYIWWLIFCPIITQFKFSRQNCNKISHYKLSQNLSTWKWVVSRGQADITNNIDLQHPVGVSVHKCNLRSLQLYSTHNNLLVQVFLAASFVTKI
jgi:hypothetical protein